MSIGVYPRISLAAARQRAMDAMRYRRNRLAPARPAPYRCLGHGTASIGFLLDWDYDADAYTFVGTRRGERWRDHPIKGDREAQIAAILTAQARSILARWVDDYNTERPHPSLGYATPAAFAAELEKQRAGLTPPVASPALLRDNDGQSLAAAGWKTGVRSVALVIYYPSTLAFACFDVASGWINILTWSWISQMNIRAETFAIATMTTKPGLTVSTPVAAVMI